jgi:hypothetical protein
MIGVGCWGGHRAAWDGETKVKRLVMSIVMAAPLVATACEPGPISEQGYQLVFEDQFDDGVVAPIWQPFPWQQRTLMIPGAVIEGYGMMQITAKDDNDYRHSSVASLGGPHQPNYPHQPDMEAWQYGYFEARIRYTKDPFSYPAWWLYSAEHINRWPESQCPLRRAEWDILENGIVPGTDADRAHQSVIHSNSGGDCGESDRHRYYQYDRPAGGLSDWHVWAGKWTPGQVCTYIDGGLAGCQATYDTSHQPMAMVFQMGIQRRSGIRGAPLPEYHMQIDWVRVWQKPPG